ncbi:MAG: UDP-N-acetylmuramoyl-L-alanine--D-glutamate ligase [Ardenticatenaceae bacterium]|nr:UDP-N-acetylmuramoyl-L-alanine--D-glutamate ligase [Anaerolineales bacterium]MCB8922317.1 UDP-N-acetylmuramoyl-L-alanine--D-glutamate ligase [Ardenticatenaceae bacterium]MCB8990499.1 UDP-N-acetylmuramoyl-L-alanine--D-glutamate ligase [Ardenticatenaceae bacterium]
MDDLRGKRLVILGLARQGQALARFAAEVGAQVVVSDLRSPQQLAGIMQQLADLEIEYVLGEHPMSLLEKADVLAISGGVPADAPLVQEAERRGVLVTNDSQEFVRRAPADVIGITGSAGKTTTTALTGVMGMTAGRRTWVGGNIGRPLIADLHKMAAEDMVVQELSSFQLEIWNQSPHVAAVLNITPNHLDRHKTMAAYAGAKSNILRHQSADDVAVLCADDPGSMALSLLAKGRLRLFSLRREVADGAFVRDGQVWLRNGHETAVLPISEIPLPGQHNVLNVLAAVTLADSVGIAPEAMAQAVRSFQGVEHRLERVAVVNGVQFINDSIATAPERVLAALASFSQPLVLLAGGKDKDMVWDEWTRRVTAQVKHVVLFGALAEMLAERLTAVHYTHFTRVETLAEAVDVAVETAVPNDIVLLSPGGTSFDAFPDFAARGEAFREMVRQL